MLFYLDLCQVLQQKNLTELESIGDARGRYTLFPNNSLLQRGIYMRGWQNYQNCKTRKSKVYMAEWKDAIQ